MDAGGGVGGHHGHHPRRPSRAPTCVLCHENARERIMAAFTDNRPVLALDIDEVLAGFVPALLLWIGLGFAVWLTARRRGYEPQRQTRPKFGEVTRAFTGGIWALLFPVFLLVGLRMGVFTPSEIGAFAVLYGGGPRLKTNLHIS